MEFSDKEKSNILQKHFCTVFTNEPEGDIPILPRRTETFTSTLHVTIGMVKKAIFVMNVNNPIALLLNRTMEEGGIPNDRKKTIVSPIYKKGYKLN